MNRKISQKSNEEITPDQVINSKKIYSGKVISLSVDTVRMKDGREVMREKITHPGAVAVVPMDDSGNIIMIRQYRHAVNDILWELPAGKLEPDEDPEDCARRELAEETGWTPGKLKKIASFFTAPGFASEIIHLFIAENLRKAEAVQDEDEDIIVYSLPWDECIEMIKSGHIEDAKTIIGLYMIADHMT